MVGKSLTLECIAKGYPEPTIQWKRWGNRVTSYGSREVYSNGTLFFKMFTKDQTGDYQCVARNSDGESEVKTATVLSIGKFRIQYFFKIKNHVLY